MVAGSLPPVGPLESRTHGNTVSRCGDRSRSDYGISRTARTAVVRSGSSRDRSAAQRRPVSEPGRYPSRATDSGAGKCSPSVTEQPTARLRAAAHGAEYRASLRTNRRFRRSARGSDMCSELGVVHEARR